MASLNITYKGNISRSNKSSHFYGNLNNSANFWHQLHPLSLDINANSFKSSFTTKNLINYNSAENGLKCLIFSVSASYLCQVEGHGGTLVQLMSENCQKFPSTDLKNILYFDIPMYPSFICHTKFGLSPHGLDFGIFGPL